MRGRRSELRAARTWSRPPIAVDALACLAGLTKETDRRSVLQGTDRLFECLEGVVRTCPECSKKKLPLGALIVHLNDAHHWTRERIAARVPDADVPQDESHAHH